MEVVGYRSPFYPPAKDYEESEAGIERLMKAVYGEIDAEEMADLKAQRLERFKARREKATKSAQKMLRQVNRPVCRRDMLAAMDAAVRCLGKELAPKNIRINTVAPAFIKTAIFDTFKDETAGSADADDIVARQYLGLGEPQDVANMIAFLLSKVSRFITGSTIGIDGGRLSS